ncbi:AtpZ/AtpI family protein, partial [Candidatus Nomurabacteria bacterium]|nr:AtpZ/AtpI family protein [Candidatus Nomurabacteria bacterium]
INKPWWSQAVQLFSEVSTYIVVPIVIALIAGKALDSHFGTKPWIFIALAGFGFLVSCYGIYKVIKRYAEELKDLNKENKN